MSHALVVHCRRQKCDVYVGRVGRKKDGPGWGNPFLMGVDGDRATVIAKFERWVLERPWLVQRVREQLRGKTLGCFCAPQDCHGDVLATLAATTPVPHTPHDPCKGRPQDQPCPVCEGGLIICKDCGLSEGALTTECSKTRVSGEDTARIYAGARNFIAGRWVDAAYQEDGTQNMPWWCGQVCVLPPA